MQCGGLLIKEPQGYGTEERDVEELVKISLAFSPGIVKLYREVQISGIDNHHLPHGYLDMMIYAIDKKEVFIAIKDYESHSIAGVSHSEVGRLSITSAKTSDTFGKIGSDRQCTVEVLAFSEVLKQLNANIKFVILIKACKSKFQLYIYFTQNDVLLRTTEIHLTDQHQQANVMGMFAFFLTINHQINTEMMEFTEDMKCGWQKAYEKLGQNYLSYLSPQKLSPLQKSATNRKRSQHSDKTVKKMRFSPIDY